MGILTTLGQGQGYLKAGFLGFNKSGKTYTAITLAIGTRKEMGHAGPIAFFDTEGGSEYVAERVKKETGKDLVGVKSRALKDLLTTVDECVSSGVSVLVVDSVTHVWREVCDSYLAQLNKSRADRGWSKINKMEFQHWAAVKGIWGKWADLYLNAPIHIIICGRAGYEYEMESNEEGKKELVKTGTKMKTESEFGYEPSLLIEMDREQVADGKGGYKIRRTATIIGDRFNIIDGKVFADPTYEHFKPHVERLKPKSHTPIDMALKTETGADADGNPDWQREKKTREILCEEIQGVITAKYPGQTAEEKKAKVELLQAHFGTRSWTAVEGTQSEDLRSGLAAMKKALGVS